MGAKYTVEQDRNWYNGLPTKRSSAAMVLRDGDSVLMVKDDYKAYWTFPGGVIDAGESPFVAALRETYEEIGVEVSREHARFLSVSYVPEKHGFLDRFHFFFYAEIQRDGLAIVPEKGIEDYAWIAISEIGRKSGERPGYVRLQSMLETGQTEYYFEAPTIA
ncbi:NUDIX hydrolase [Candidatus Saccharibacteria bacterium]|nr:NUDIX hydrolase [Candidatus Saccharibacteria bacterium]MBH1973422.1 NUDIX hydrolase [Candidatus Saccharibacteria bacterium]MBH1990337.1 NUDIX hydrolase [Candidatus Saccharibacteria bacterium]